ncbi:endonuclease Q family protein [Robertmurraya korlensis]|uniref:endonuclease Q family protein n=1 Tax=Robertmurraya korlensis TaxID=519977 RepID=UPI000826731E|nr:endonuclease Q family protein [Robertmurraya korlensis]
MNSYFADLHIHIGRTWNGKAVKITGAKSLTFTNIIQHARTIKGLDIIGIIDCHSPEVIQEMESLIREGELIEAPRGGLLYGDMLILMGSELEIYDDNCKGPIHILAFLPDMTRLKEFSQWLSNHLKNINLSSQRVYVTGLELQKKVKELGGLFIPAHVFTPFKSLFGKGVEQSLTEVFDPDLIDGIELGLSANTQMADQISELHRYSYVTNSDAHSLGKIAREYQQIKMKELSFTSFQEALYNQEGQYVEANYGLDPLLGKYHETVCANCNEKVLVSNHSCEACGHTKFIKGVATRIRELQTAKEGKRGRPPYIHQVPLDFIPGLGPKLFQKLLDHFGTEMAILHHVPEEAIQEVVPKRVADLIISARKGELHFHAGGGGKYGKIIE